MSFAQTFIGGGTLIGLATLFIQTVAPNDQRPPAITIRHIEIRSDGSVFYDRDTIEGELLTWQGIMWDAAGNVHCSGHGQDHYFDRDNPLDSKNLAWMISQECDASIGVEYAFDWFPADATKKPVHWPPNGRGRVLPAKE